MYMRDLHRQGVARTFQSYRSLAAIAAIISLIVHDYEIKEKIGVLSHTLSFSSRWRMYIHNACTLASIGYWRASSKNSRLVVILRLPVILGVPDALGNRTANFFWDTMASD